MGASKAVGPAAAAYAAALRTAVDDFLSLGGTQKDIAVAAHVAPATLSRYLNGERIAPREFIASLDAFLAARGRPLDTNVRARLIELCGQAHEASGSPAVQLAHLKEELAQVRKKKGDREAELAALQRHTDQLAAELQQALDRARRSDKDRLALEGRVAEQEKSLQHAQTYTRQLQTELTALHEQVVLVQREVKVLRRQNQQLLAESAVRPGSHVEEPVSGVSTQAGRAGRKTSQSSGSTDREGKTKEGRRRGPKKTKPGSRPRERAPQTGGQDTADHRGAPVLDLSWTGNEDPRTFSKKDVGGGIGLLAVAFLLLFGAIFGWMKGDPTWAYVTGSILLVAGVIEADDMRPPNGVRRLMRERTLRLDSTGLLTSDSSGEQHFPWTAIKKISVHHTNAINQHAPLALHIQLQVSSAEADLVHRPAGWPLDVDPPEVCQRPPHKWANEWVPVCLLGPLSGPDKTNLQNTVAAYLQNPLAGIW
ncbi:hypothetical protein AB0O68_34655 [Streptomyces sp. NPDC087512]|uniref:helix-turn-helix domain-containing protein n=1 Tax=Streptomyces sp. NPDC087512 TaxID=3155059 RepID=UPI0034381965